MDVNKRLKKFVFDGLTLAIRPFRAVNRWVMNLALMQKIILVMVSILVWLAGSVKPIEPKISASSFTLPTLALNPAWLIILGAAVLLILVLILMARRSKRKVDRITASQPPDDTPQSTGSSRAWKPEFPKIPSPGFDSRDFYTIVAVLLVVLCLYLGFT